MRVRAMASGDAGEVAALCEQLGYDAAAAQVAHRLGLLRERGDCAVYVAESEETDVDGDGETGEERVVGWVQVHGRVLLAVDPYAEIGALVVERRSRGRGIGRLLVATAEDWARGRGYDVVRLEAETARESAHEFFERLGYTREATAYTFGKEV